MTTSSVLLENMPSFADNKFLCGKVSQQNHTKSIHFAGELPQHHGFSASYLPHLHPFAGTEIQQIWNKSQKKVPWFLQLRPWLLVIRGYFYGIIHEPYMGLVLILSYTGWWFQPLRKNMLVTWDYDIPIEYGKNMFQTTNQWLLTINHH